MIKMPKFKTGMARTTKTFKKKNVFKLMKNS